MASISFANTQVLYIGVCALFLVTLLGTAILRHWIRSVSGFTLVSAQCIAAALCVLWAFSEPQLTMQKPTVQPATWNITGVIDDSGSVSVCMPKNDDEASLSAMPACSEDSVFTGFSVARDAFVSMAIHRDQDHFAAIVLGDDSVIISRHGGDKSPTENTIAGLHNIKPRFGGTNITASLRDAVNDLKSVSARRILVIATDGEDEIKIKDHNDLVADILKYDIKVYWIYIQRPFYASYTAGSTFPYLIEKAQGTILPVKSQAGAYEAVKEISWQLGQGTEGKMVTTTQDVSGYFGVLAAISVCFAFFGLMTVVSMSRQANAQQAATPDAVAASDPTPELAVKPSADGPLSPLPGPDLGLKPSADWPSTSVKQPGPDRDGPVSEQ